MFKILVFQLSSMFEYVCNKKKLERKRTDLYLP